MASKKDKWTFFGGLVAFFTNGRKHLYLEDTFRLLYDMKEAEQPLTDLVASQKAALARLRKRRVDFENHL